MISEVAMPSDEILSTELATFERRRTELIGAAQGRYALIKGEEVVGTYESESDAIAEGYRRFGNVPFLVKHLVSAERPLNFFSGLISL